MFRLLLTGSALLGLGLCACGDDQAAANQTVVLDAQGFSAFETSAGLSTAAGLVRKAQLQEALQGVGSYTLFAPSDDAFAALPRDQRALLDSEEGRPQLVALLRQHMAPGYFTAEAMAEAVQRGDGGAELASLGAAPIALGSRSGGLVLGEGESAARIVGEPIRVGNSLIYRIDRLLPPPAEDEA